MRWTNPPILGGQKAFLNLNCDYVHLEQETDEGKGLEKEKNANFGDILPDLRKIWLKYKLINETIYAGKRLKQFISDTMVGSVKEDRRTGKAKVSSEVHQKATK